jgi:hypothetical protein
MRRMPIQLFSTFPLIIVLLVACSAQLSEHPAGKAQTDRTEVRLVKLHYTNTGGEVGMTTYHYDRSGVQHQAVWELLDGSRSSLNWHTFDRQGHLVAKYREFSDGLTSLLRYEYDDGGHLIGEQFERSDGVTGTVHYELDADGKTVRADCRGRNGWFYGLITYQYDGSGRKTGGDIEQQGETVGNIRYTYNDHGDLDREVWDFPGVWSQMFIYEYRRVILPANPVGTISNAFVSHSGAYRLIGEDYSYNGTQGGPSTYEYDSGLLVKKVFTRSDGLRTETTYEYDPDGILLTSHRSYSNGLTAIFTYEFDGNRRLVRRGFERSDGLTGAEIYTFDWKGNLSTARYDNMDGWLTGDITFQMDDRCRLAQGTFHGENDFDADIMFESDPHGNIARIRWDFSFGAYQEYTFTWEELPAL